MYGKVDEAGLALDDNTGTTVAVGNRAADGGAEYATRNVGVKPTLTDQIALDVHWYDTDGHEFDEPHDGRLVTSLRLAL